MFKNTLPEIHYKCYRGEKNKFLISFTLGGEKNKLLISFILGIINLGSNYFLYY